MKKFKRYISGVLVCLILFSSIDLSWCDLSGTLDTLAAAYSATDCYEALDKLGAYTKNEIGDVKRVLGIPNTSEGTDTSANNSLTLETFNWTLDANRQLGVYTFDQKNIEGTAQYKSGNWLNDTQYEATAGTPTTEDIFLTTGGTQWIVDLQYRYIKAPYRRTYTFSADAANYRYYQLGSTRSAYDSSGEVTYKATMEVLFNEDPVIYSKYEDSDGHSSNNYGYKYHMGFPGKEQAKVSTLTVPSVYRGNKSVQCLNPEHWGDSSCNVSSDIIAGVATNISSVEGSSEYTPPDVANAILVKQQIYQAIDELKVWWSKQADNYRADEASYDTDGNVVSLGYNSSGDELEDDELSFMYTYGGMARYGTTAGKDEDQRATGGGDSTFSKNLWTPTFVTYLYDWKAYYEHNDMSTEYGSTAVKMKTFSDVGINKRDFYDNIFGLVKGNPTGSIALEDSFAINFKHSRAHLPQYVSISNYNDDFKVDTTYIERMQANGARENMSVLLNDFGNIYAISEQLASPPMGLTGKEYGNYGPGLAYNLTTGAYSELAYLYYKSIYTLALNYGSLFYADEANYLFSGLPGFKYPTDVDTYNKIVNGNLAAVFGNDTQGNHTTIGKDQETVIPFANFPWGGDLDGEMTDWRSKSTNVVSGETVTKLIALGAADTDRYFYNVKLTIREDKSTTLTDTGTVGQFALDRCQLNTYTGELRCIGDNATGDLGVANLSVHSGCMIGTKNFSRGTDGKCTVCSKTEDACTCTFSTCDVGLHSCGHYLKLADFSDGNNPVGATRTFVAAANGTAQNYNHLKRAYEETYSMKASWKLEQGGEGALGANDDWNWVPSMSDKQTLIQEFKDVQWLDITSYTLWHLNSSESRGLSTLLVQPMNSANVDKVQGDNIFTKAVDQLGYTVYNLRDNDYTVNTYSTIGNAIFSNVSGAYVNNLETKGRIANSFNKGSLGNNNGVTIKVRNDDGCQNTDGDGGGWDNSNYAVAYSKNDVPDTTSYFINSDFTTYHMSPDSTNDDLHFVYNPYAQGGRSNTTFYGFVSQALAHTLYYKEGNGTYYSANLPGISYSNSFRVQGDYLSLNRHDNSMLTMAGMLYDTWGERFSGTTNSGSSSSNAGGKFSLMPNGWNDLTVYASTCPWVPGRLQYLMARSDKDKLYLDGSITSTNNCFIIHTYCGGINGNTHNSWDSVEGASGGSAEDCEGQGCTRGAITDKGSVNTQELREDESPKRVVKRGSLSDEYNAQKQRDSFTIDTSQTVKLADVMKAVGSSYYGTYSGYNGALCKVDPSADSLTSVIQIYLNNYLTDGANIETLMTERSDLATQMPYVGYQSQGNGVQRIDFNNSDTTQMGYYVGYNSYFDPSNTYVSDDKRDGGFARFGVYNPNDTIVANRYNNNSRGSDAFSSKYPWLADLNVQRDLPNNRYNTGHVYNHYSRVANVDDATVTRTVHSDSSELKVDAHYLKGNATSTSAGPAKSPNDIVLYNPVSTESSRIIPLSEFVTDASNTGTNGSGNRNYHGNYMDSFSKLVNRDTRLSSKIRLDLMNNQEQYLTGSGVNTSSTITRVKSHYELKDEADVVTTPFNTHDYDSVTNLDVTFDDNSLSNGESLFIDYLGDYDFVYNHSPDKYVASTASLMQGDTVKFVSDDRGSALLLTMNEYAGISLPWSTFINTYNEVFNKSFTTDEPSLFFSQSSGLSIGQGLRLRKGATLKLSMDVTSDTTISDYTVTLDTIDGISYNYEFEEDNGIYTYTWYLEAEQDVTIESLDFRFGTDVYLLKSENFIECQDVVLMYCGDGIYDPNECSPTYWWHGYSDMTFSDSNTYTFVNNYACSERNSRELVGVTQSVTGVVYFSKQGGNCTVTLKEDAVHASHRSPNSCWMYYVMGWSTPSGHFITTQDVEDALANPTDQTRLLNNPATVLNAPSGKSVTVGTLLNAISNNTLGIYRLYNGSYGLLDIRADGTFDRISIYTGVSIPTGYTFDMMSFGEGGTTVTGVVMGTTQYSYGSYECVWRATKDEGICYDVKQSQNASHRCSYESHNSCCWKLEPAQSVEFTEADYKALFEDTLSLDDEFTLYWDNYASLCADEGSRTVPREIIATSNQLGRGWDNVDDAVEDLHNPRRLQEDDTHSQITELPDVPIKQQDGSVVNTGFWDVYTDDTLTDTTKWIKSKYVIFNVDMYAFTTKESFVYDDSKGDEQFDPTTPAYSSNGTPNNIVYIPAGEKVYLGYYKLDLNASENDADNTGGFIDYGYNIGGNGNLKLTKDPNKDYYTYHFWCPLGIGETENGAIVKFVVESINHTAGSNKLADTSTTGVGLVSTTGTGNSAPELLNEWGDKVVTAAGVKMFNNDKVISNTDLTVYNNNDGINSYTTTFTDSNAYKRYTNSANSNAFSIQGRVGALTVVDSGDPRYQDTFKASNDTGDYAISPVVRKIDSYSNVQGIRGSQFKYLADVQDIRGRIFDTTYSTSTYKVVNDGDTYAGAEWHFSDANNSNKSYLPMTSSFNIHKEFKDTLTTSKLGYELYCSLQTIGNYFGSSGQRTTNEKEPTVNNNLDYGQHKVQVHPMYVAVDGNNIYPVDVYVRRGSNYELINAGSMYASKEEATAAGSTDAGPYYLDDAFDANYTSYINTNSHPDNMSNGAYVLDQNMLRRMVTDVESNITNKCVHNPYATNFKRITTSMLDSNSYDYSAEIGGQGLGYEYVYGNAQFLFLRERNRTFMGGVTSALDEDELPSIPDNTSDPNYFKSELFRYAERYAQKYYFGLGLPSSAVFVKHGEDTRESNILNGKSGVYILCLVDVYAIGDTWAVQYKSKLSGEAIVVNGKKLHADDWNVYRETMPYAIPVHMYNLTKESSASDMDTQGSH